MRGFWRDTRTDENREVAALSTDIGFIDFVLEQISGVGEVRHRAMFGEYMVYVNDKPILLVCDDTVFVKIVAALDEVLAGAEKGFPYDSAKEHYILDIDDAELARKVIGILEPITPLPKKRKKK
jgi:TfoX/Sxy family transcriptional regulator of competence genes